MVSRKRLGALLLMLALLVPSLAACGGGGTTTVPTAAPAPSAAATAVPVAAAPTAITEATAAPAAAAPTAMANAPTAMSADVPTAMAAPGGATSGATAGSSGDVTKIQVEDGAQLRFGAAGNPAEQKLYIEGADRFNKLFPNVKLTFEPINDFQTSMKAAMAGNTAPDVFLLDGELMGAFAPNNLLLPLDDAMTTAGVKASDYVESLIKLYQSDGKTYGIPKDFNPLVVFVNNDLASKAGVDPASIKTWDDLKAAAKKLTQGDGPGKTYGMCLNSDILRSGAFIFQTGNAFIKDNKAVFNDDNGVKAIEFWKSFKDDGTGELFGELGKGWCGEAFASKTTGMAIEGGWMVPFMKDPANGAQDMKYTAIPLPIPAGGKPASWLFTNGFAASARTKYPKAAAAAVMFLSSAANQQALIPSGLASPSLLSLANDSYFKSNTIAKVLVDQGPTGQLADTVLGGPVKKGDVLKPINDAQERIFLGAQTVKEALDQAAKEADAVLAK